MKRNDGKKYKIYPYINISLTLPKLNILVPELLVTFGSKQVWYVIECRHTPPAN